MKHFMTAVFAVFALAHVTSSSAAASGMINLYIRCDATTPLVRKLELTNGSPLPNLPSSVCVDKGSALIGLSVPKIELRQAETIDAYMLFVSIPPKRWEDLARFSSQHLKQTLVVTKDGKYLVDGVIYAPMMEGKLTIGVPSPEAGHLLGDAISGHKSSYRRASEN